LQLSPFKGFCANLIDLTTKNTLGIRDWTNEYLVTFQLAVKASETYSGRLSGHWSLN